MPGSPFLRSVYRHAPREQELPDDQEGPPVADDVEGLGNRAELTVTAHETRLTHGWLISKSNDLTFSTCQLSI